MICCSTSVQKYTLFYLLVKNVNCYLGKKSVAYSYTCKKLLNCVF